MNSTTHFTTPSLSFHHLPCERSDQVPWFPGVVNDMHTAVSRSMCLKPSCFGLPSVRGGYQMPNKWASLKMSTWSSSVCNLVGHLATSRCLSVSAGCLNYRLYSFVRQHQQTRITSTVSLSMPCCTADEATSASPIVANSPSLPESMRQRRTCLTISFPFNV